MASSNHTEPLPHTLEIKYEVYFTDTGHVFKTIHPALRPTVVYPESNPVPENAVLACNVEFGDITVYRFEVEESWEGGQGVGVVVKEDGWEEVIGIHKLDKLSPIEESKESDTGFEDILIIGLDEQVKLSPIEEHEESESDPDSEEILSTGVDEQGSQFYASEQDAHSKQDAPPPPIPPKHPARAVRLVLTQQDWDFLEKCGTGVVQGDDDPLAGELPVSTLAATSIDVPSHQESLSDAERYTNNQLPGQPDCNKPIPIPEDYPTTPAPPRNDKWASFLHYLEYCSSTHSSVRERRESAELVAFGRSLDHKDPCTSSPLRWSRREEQLKDLWRNCDSVRDRICADTLLRKARKFRYDDGCVEANGPEELEETPVECDEEEKFQRWLTPSRPQLKDELFQAQSAAEEPEEHFERRSKGNPKLDVMSLFEWLKYEDQQQLARQPVSVLPSAKAETEKDVRHIDLREQAEQALPSSPAAQKSIPLMEAARGLSTTQQTTRSVPMPPASDPKPTLSRFLFPRTARYNSQRNARSRKGLYSQLKRSTSSLEQSSTSSSSPHHAIPFAQGALPSPSLSFITYPSLRRRGRLTVPSKPLLKHRTTPFPFADDGHGLAKQQDANEAFDQFYDKAIEDDDSMERRAKAWFKLENNQYHDHIKRLARNLESSDRKQRRETVLAASKRWWKQQIKAKDIDEGKTFKVMKMKRGIEVGDEITETTITVKEGKKDEVKVVSPSLLPLSFLCVM